MVKVRNFGIPDIAAVIFDAGIERPHGGDRQKRVFRAMYNPQRHLCHFRSVIDIPIAADGDSGGKYVRIAEYSAIRAKTTLRTSDDVNPVQVNGAALDKPPQYIYGVWQRLPAKEFGVGRVLSVRNRPCLALGGCGYHDIGRKITFHVRCHQMFRGIGSSRPAVKDHNERILFSGRHSPGGMKPIGEDTLPGTRSRFELCPFKISRVVFCRFIGSRHFIYYPASFNDAGIEGIPEQTGDANKNFQADNGSNDNCAPRYLQTSFSIAASLLRNLIGTK